MSAEAEALQAIIDRMDTAARLTEQAAQQLAANLNDARDLLAEDRRQISRLILLTQRLLAQSEDTGRSTTRLELGAQHVAQDLAASIDRADHASADIAGAGADAALRSAGETAAGLAAHDGRGSS